jgi:ATP-dependent Clp protease ATP-binding subunit ClpC
MFEKFTDSARRVVVLSQEESRMLGHGYIGTEHLLLGALEACRETGLTGIDIDRIRDVVGKRVPPNPKLQAGHIPFTNEAKQVLERSLRETLAAHHTNVSPWHILLATVSDPAYTSTQVLTDLDVGLDDLRGCVRDGMQRDAATPQSAAGQPPDLVTRVTSLEYHVRQLTAQVSHLRRRLDEGA